MLGGSKSVDRIVDQGSQEHLARPVGAFSKSHVVDVHSLGAQVTQGICTDDGCRDKAKSSGRVAYSGSSNHRLRWWVCFNFSKNTRLIYAGRIDQARVKAVGTIVSQLHDLLDGFRRNDYRCPNGGSSFECGCMLYGALTKEMDLAGLLVPYPVAPFSGNEFRGFVLEDPQYQVACMERFRIQSVSPTHLLPQEKASGFRR
jgi:hypothetical protein